MTRFHVYLVVLATAMLCHFGSAASIPQEDDVQALRSLSEPGEESVGIPSKRFASHYFTNLRAKHYDKAAMQRFLQNRFVGKRDSNIGTSQEAPRNLLLPTSGFIAFFAPLDDDVVSNILSRVDEPYIEK